MKLSRLFSLLLCAALLLTAASCGKSGGGEEETGDIVIGSINDITGPTAFLGNSVVNCFQYMVDEFNENGGLNGRKIKFINYDTENDPTQAINAYRRLAESDHASIVLGSVISDVNISVAPVTESVGVPMIGIAIDPRTCVQEDGNVYKYSFIGQITSDGQGVAAAKIAIDHLGVTKVGVLYNQGNAYAVSLAEPFQKYCEENDIEVVMEPFQNEDQDLRTQLTHLTSLGVEAIYEPNQQAHQVIGVTQAREVGFTGDLIGNNGSNPYVLEAGEQAEGFVFPNNVAFDSEECEALTTRYQEDYGAAPATQGFLAQDIFQIMIAALEKAESSDPAAVTEALNGLTVETTYQGELTLGADTHYPTGLGMFIEEVQDGKMVTVGETGPCS